MCFLLLIEYNEEFFCHNLSPKKGLEGRCHIVLVDINYYFVLFSINCIVTRTDTTLRSKPFSVVLAGEKSASGTLDVPQATHK